MTLRVKWTLGLLILFFVAVLLLSNRYQVINKDWGFIRFDRWTGRAEACSNSGCAEYGPYQEPPTPPAQEATGTMADNFNTLVELYNGTTLEFASTTPETTIESIAKRVTLCIKQSRSQEASETCARPSVDEQLGVNAFRVVKHGVDYEKLGM